METEDEMEEELSEATGMEVNHNNNLGNFETMRISSRTSERGDESNDHLEINLQVNTKNDREESKLSLSTSMKTDIKECERRLCRTKRISCQQDTIHEYDEDDGLTMDRVGRYMEAHPNVVETWLYEKASLELRQRLQTPRLERTKSITSTSCQDQEGILNRPKRNSVTSDLFQTWLSTSSPAKRSRSPSRASISLMGRREELNRLDESDLFMELIRDVANELDINVLCHKILVNVGILTYADRGSLFLAKGPLEDRYLVAKLFDVTQDTELEEAVQRAKNEEIKIPFGVGIAGYVAETKEIINIKDAYKDPRFNSAIDMRTGYKTTLILSMPICNYEGDVIGVAQIINKTNGSNEFTERDVEVFQRYLTFCGIGIQNAQLFELSVQEYRRNQILLNLARNIFEEQNNLECLVTKIMTEAKELLKCERCAVYLLDLDCGEAGHLEKIVERPSKSIQENRKPLSRRESNNIDMEDIFQQHSSIESSKFTMIFEMDNETQEARVYRPSTNDLSSPLGQIARYVAATGQILNIGDVTSWLKKDVVETEKESTRSILCMPIANGQRTVIGVAQLINKDNGTSFTDSDVSIFEAFAIFCGLGIHNTQMYESACKLMAKQKVALECLSYHATANNDDALKLTSDSIPSAEKFNLYSFTFTDFDLTDDDTCRATIRMFKQCNLIHKFHIPYDILCRWILSVKKNYRPVKYHNWRHALNVAQTMFAMLKTGRMEQFMTDLEILGLLVACLCHDLDHRVLCGMMMTACDVSAIAKPWEVQHRVAKLVADEFFDQGDLERLQLNQQPVAMMDRERRDELPQMQVGFIDEICMPLYKVMAETFPWIMPLYEGTKENRRHWQDLAEKVEMGLTWIDRDTIEEPVEEFVSYEPRDIEFTVTTLNCTHPDRKDQVQEKSALARFTSFRKGGRTLSKGVRQRLSKSLYVKTTSEDTSKTKVLISERKSRNKLCLLI
ncbi:cGMP-specific 3',5'-cyclic phosphodiesterase isoform X3 [Vespa velutina]|uniref:cGMP-specific 3',5'-cyclic phosphodiesterase isoform X3 n=1 Tax=Vespa velutina TaxID=202808 RepID=UPI001FB4C1D3|nr:cGMP-specific 3',5'-cyclic phosphodiesterase isoform X3 [Vespa velutina]